MYKTGTIRALFAIVDVVGVLGIIAGIILAINGASEARYAGSVIPGVAVAVSGFSCFIISHIGRSLAAIAETNEAILKRLSPPSDLDGDQDDGDDSEPTLPPGMFYPGQPVGR